MNEYSLQSLVERSNQRTVSPQVRPATKIEEEAEYQAFQFGRVGPRAEHMLEICFCDGFCWSKPYIEITDIRSSNPDNGFEIYFQDVAFGIKGQKLSLCYRYLKQHRLESIRECNRAEVMKLAEHESVVHSIKAYKPPQDKLSRPAS